MNKLRIVVDVNVIVSALLFLNSNPRKTLDIIRKNHHILMSKSIFTELENVLNRPKFDRYITKNEREEFLQEFDKELVFITITETITDCRDPKDNKYLEVAVSGKAQYLITGDQDLLVLNTFRGINIIKPEEFLSITE